MMFHSSRSLARSAVVVSLAAIVATALPAGASVAPEHTAAAAAEPMIDAISPEFGVVGAEVTLSGSGFTGATEVTLGSLSTTFVVDSDAQLVATVPEDAVDAPFTVITPDGSASSAQTFTVDVPPGPVTNLRATPPPGDKTVFLAWQNPTIADLAQVRVRRTSTTTPPGPNGGIAVYSGTGTAARATGLVNGTTYRFWAYVADTAGQWSPHATVSVVPVAPKATSLSLSRSTGTVTYGSPVKLIAKLLSGSTARPGETVKFYSRRRGATTWTQFASGTTSSTGYVSTTHKPAGHREYRAVHPKTLYYAASTSRTVAVSVRPALTAKLSPAAALNGTTVRVTGTLKPAHSGQYVHLQRLTSDGWRLVTKAKLSSTGSYSLATRPTSSGSYTYRVYKPADSDHLAVTSSKRTYRAYRVEISTIHYDASGNDYNNLSDEYAVLKNTGKVSVNLKGWRLYAGDAAQTFTLPSYSLSPGATVRVITGSGGSGIRLYQNRPIWNNDGETGKLYDPRGAVADTYSY